MLTLMQVRNKSHLKMIISIFLFFIVILFTGCIEEIQKITDKNDKETEITQDNPAILPNWRDGDYHDYYKTTQMLNDLNDKYPDLTNVFSIGKSVLDRDIWCIRITNENN